MKKDILTLYHQELEALHQQGKRFADIHPKVASKLRLNQRDHQDPFVERLIQSTAFLTARVQSQIDADYQQFLYNLAEQICPILFKPFPSTSILQFDAPEKFEKGKVLSRGAVVETRLKDNQPCRFTTCYDVTLYPLKITNANYINQPHLPAANVDVKQCKSRLEISLQLTDPQIGFKDIELDNLLVYLDLSHLHGNQLQELLLHKMANVLVEIGQAHQYLPIPVESVQRVGFSENESLMPYPNLYPNNYQLLSEYFTFNKKFRFFRLTNLKEYLAAYEGDHIKLHFLFKDVQHELVNIINQHAFKLHCTPIVNVFPIEAEPIKVTSTSTRYQVIPSYQQPMESIEVFSMAGMEAVCDEAIHCLPYFGRKMEQVSELPSLYWQVARKPCEAIGAYQVNGYETFIDLTQESELPLPSSIVLQPQLLCLNRDLPAKRINAEEASFELVSNESQSSVGARLLYNFTNPIYPTNARIDQAMIQKLTATQLLFQDEQYSLEALKRALLLYDVTQSYETAISEGLLDLRCETVLKRHPHSMHFSMIQGLKIILTVNPSAFSSDDLFLFGEMLVQYLSRSIAINHFITLEMRSKAKETLYCWEQIMGVEEGL